MKKFTESIKYSKIHVDGYKLTHMILKKRNHKGYWTKEKCKEEALKYKSRWEFEKNSSGAYNATRRNKWGNEVCSHMLNK